MEQVDMITVDRREEWYVRAAKHICRRVGASTVEWSPTELSVYFPSFHETRLMDARTLVEANWKYHR